jgi:hypothetical protein
MPGNRPPVGIQPRGNPIEEIRLVDVVLDVFLPAPHYFYRSVDLFGDRHRLGDTVHVESSAETPANQMIVHLDLLRWQSGNLRGGGLSAADHLVSHPDVATILAYMHCTVHRLHRGVCQERKLVHSLYLLGGAGQGLDDIAFFLATTPGF